MIKRNKTPSEYIGYGLYLYFSGLSLRRASQMLSCFIRRNHVTIWNWIQKYKPQKIKSKRKKVSEYIVDETMLKVGSEYIWLWWIAIEPENKQILALYVSKEREKHVCSRTLSVTDVVHNYGIYPVFQPMVKEPGTQWLVGF